LIGADHEQIRAARAVEAGPVEVIERVVELAHNGGLRGDEVVFAFEQRREPFAYAAVSVALRRFVHNLP